MGWLIRVMGVGVIFAVGAILLFIIWQVLPLGFGARVSDVVRVADVGTGVRLCGLKPDGAGWWVWSETGDWFEGEMANGRPVRVKSRQELLWAEGARAWAWEAGFSTLVVGALQGGQPENGQVWVLRLVEVSWGGLDSEFKLVEESILGEVDSELVSVSAGQGAEGRVYAAGFANGELWVRRDFRRRTLVGGGGWRAGEWEKLAPGGGAEHSGNVGVAGVLVPDTGDGVVVLRVGGRAEYWFYVAGRGWELRQIFYPAGEGEQVGAIGFVFGDVSLLVGTGAGKVRRWSLSHDEGTGARVFFDVGVLPGPEGVLRGVGNNLRNKSVVLFSEQELVIVNATTGSVRWRKEIGSGVSAAAFDAAGSVLMACGAEGMRLWRVDDPHQDAGWRAFFGKLWYEGRSGPEYVWQSTSGTDTFEPKYSLLPLIVGSLKGAFYSLLIAVPLALGLALYVSQMMRPAARAVMKPLMELMASIPSVVLGFIGALWLAPLLAPRVPSLLMIVGGVPLGVLVVGWLFGIFGKGRTGWWTGREWFLVIPFAGVLAWMLWSLGPVVEQVVFHVPPAAGAADAGAGNFPTWWREVVGLSYEQRNALVVGIVMGFAVIPVIFTIAEDAFTNVPSSLKSGAAALGASRWQVAWMVVVPVALSGIFSAVMIGLGRAIGETMIVVMVSGNTAILDWNPFNGMRPLSANIAVEMPEAARGSTHYRVLFLGALILFVMTFVLNTAAEFVRSAFRKKMKAL